MDDKNNSPVIDRSGSARPEFNVVLAYDEIVGGMLAKECFDNLARLHGKLFHFNCKLWRFEVMQEPELFCAAVQDAAKADMMVVASRRNEAISGEAKRWVEQWTHSRGDDHEAILVLLSDKPAGADMGTSLRKMAEGHGVAFLCKEMGWRAKGWQSAARTARPMGDEARPGPAAVARAGAGQPRWGLNE
jgi:hypothetical protein